MSNTIKNIWLDGIMGVVVGDALGCPVEFVSRRVLKVESVEDMRRLEGPLILCIRCRG